MSRRTLLGFPVALALAWAFDVTPEGVRRTEPAVGQTVAGQSRAKVNLGTATLIAAFVILAGVVSVWFLVSTDSGPTLVRERIAVVPFENRTGDPARDELGTLAAEWISAGLARAGLFEVVPMGVVNQYLEASSSGDELRGLADYSRSRTLVTGSFYLQGDSIEFHAEILDAQPETPALIYALETASGPAVDPMPAIETVRARAAGALAQNLANVTAGRTELYSPPPSLEAYREVLKGRELFSRNELEEASVHYYRALEIDSAYLFPVFVLAHSYLRLGNGAKADSLLRVYENQRSRLMPVEQAWADWSRGVIDGDLDLEYRAAQEGVQLDPLGTWVYIAASTALRVNRPAEAFRHVSQQELTDERAWRWYVHLDALHLLGRHDQELKVAREARVVHPDLPGFSEREAWALAALGRLDEGRRRSRATTPVSR
jgi:tetratricopeptide (TPR) repeat protein